MKSVLAMLFGGLATLVITFTAPTVSAQEIALRLPVAQTFSWSHESTMVGKWNGTVAVQLTDQKDDRGGYIGTFKEFNGLPKCDGKSGELSWRVSADGELVAEAWRASTCGFNITRARIVDGKIVEGRWRTNRGAAQHFVAGSFTASAEK